MALLQRFSFILLFATLIGCGGGDGGLSDGGGDDGDTQDPITITLSISNNEVSEQSPATVTATVKQGSTALANKLVTFTLTDEQIAFFDVANGAVSTNSDGIATINLMAGSSSGGGSVVASLDSGETSEPLGFNSAGDGDIGAGTRANSISIFANSQQLASSGADELTITAVVKDINNNLIEGANVAFSASSGQIQVQKSVTEADGKAIAILKTNSEPNNRVISVVVVSDLVTDQLNVQVVGTTINLAGSSSLALNDSNDFILTVLDSDGNGIAETTVSLSATNSSTQTPAGDVAQLTFPSTVVTNFDGQATIPVSGSSGGTNTLVATAIGASSSKDVAVQADSFLFTHFDNNDGMTFDPSSQPQTAGEVKLSKTAEVTLTWLRSGSPVADGTVVNFTTTRGSLVSNSATTVDGKVTALVNSNNAGKALVTFTGVDGEIELNNQLEFEFIAETVETVIAQASPKSIAPNGETSTISVVVKDSNGNLVKNKLIDFTLTDIHGGTIFPASAVTDSNGSASTVYTSNTVSAQNDIVVTATVREDTSKSDSTTLTVADRELFIALGTGNLVELDSDTVYNKQYSVFVTDADSTPRENVTLTISAVPVEYYKGYWEPELDDNGEFVKWVTVVTATCNNEDINLDGILDVGEDINNNGLLTPGNVVAATGEVVTDADGRAEIDIRYGQSFGSWVNVKLVASTKVTGTESSTQTIFTIPTASVHVTNEKIMPPISNIWPRGPYGIVGDCASAL